MAKDPVRIVQYKPGQGYAEGLEKLPQTFSAGLDSLLKGYIGAGGLALQGQTLQLGKDELAAVEEKNRLDAANEATRLRVLDQTRRDKQEFAQQDLERDLKEKTLTYLTDKRKSEETARHNMEVESFNIDKLAETKAQNIRKNKQVKIAELRDAIANARTDGDMKTAMVHAKMLSTLTGDLTEYGNYAHYEKRVNKFVSSFDDYNLSADADLETRRSFLDTTRMHSLAVPAFMRDKVPSYEAFLKEDTDVKNTVATRNALVKFLETENTMLTRLLPSETIASYLANAENVSSMIDISLLQTQMGQDVSMISGARDTKLKALFEIEKEVVKAAVSEGGPGVAGPIMQTFQQMRNSISTQPQTERSDTQGILTKEQLKAQETPVTTAGVGGKIYFQSTGSDKVQLMDKSKADELTNQGKGQIIGQAGTPVDDVKANQVIYDMDGNRYKVATVSAPRRGKTVKGGGFQEKLPANVQLVKVDKAGKMQQAGTFTTDQIKNQFSSTKPVKPDPVAALKKEYEIPLEELFGRGYSISEAQEIILSRKEKELGVSVDKMDPQTRAKLEDDVMQLMLSIGYGR
jgi:ribosomal protein L13E